MPLYRPIRKRDLSAPVVNSPVSVTFASGKWRSMFILETCVFIYTETSTRIPLNEIYTCVFVQAVQMN